MNTIKITTPENIEVEYKTATILSRGAAVIIDLASIGFVLTILSIITAMLSFGNPFVNEINFDDNTLLVSIYLIFIFVVYFGYFIICEMLFKGQTLGKKMLKLRVIRQNGKPVNFISSLVRNLIRYFVDFLGVGVFMIFFSKTNRRLGDLAAGTIVISENPNKIDSTDLFASGTERTLLSDEKYALNSHEIQILSEYFKRKDSFLDPEETSDKIFSYFSKKYDVETSKINDEVLNKILKMNIC